VVTGENSTDIPYRGVSTDDDPNSPTFYGTAGAPQQLNGDRPAFGKITFEYSSNFIKSNEQAEQVSENILRLKKGFPQQITFSKLIDPRLEPLDVVTIQHDDFGLLEDVVIDSLTIPFDRDGDMSAETRLASASVLGSTV
jgi:hypothetical protein